MSLACQSECTLAIETLMEGFDCRPMGLPMGHITEVVDIKFWGRILYPKKVTYIYHVYPKFWVDSSVIVRPVKVTTF